MVLIRFLREYDPIENWHNGVKERYVLIKLISIYSCFTELKIEGFYFHHRNSSTFAYLYHILSKDKDLRR